MARRRYELRDREWAIIEPLLPNKPRGVARGIWANIPNRSNRKKRFGFSPWLYKQRHRVERFFNQIKQFRGIATRYDKCPENDLAAIKLVCVRLWCAN